MLSSIHIENIAVIEKADIEFNMGFNVLTGETGAGKSIIIDSINAILGERTSRDLVRTGADFALVTALFSDVSKNVRDVLNKLNYQVDNEILISKKINKDGKSSIRINGIPATTSILKSISQKLINIHGQHDSQELLSKEYHIKFLDCFAQNKDLLDKYSQVYNQYKFYKKQLNTLINDENNAIEKTEILKYSIGELEAANIQIGEIERLKAQRDLIKNSEKIINQLSVVNSLLDDNGESSGVVSNIKLIISLLSQLTVYMPELTQSNENLNSLSYELDEVQQIVNNKINAVEFDPHQLQFIEERLDYLYKLSSKYGDTEEQMIEYLSKAKNEYNKIANYDNEIEQLTIKCDNLAESLMKSAQLLTESRIKSGNKLSDLICNELEFLDMPKVKFIVDIKDKTYGASGKDDVEFLISANLGENAKPLYKIASGGELSRIMLAIKSILSDNDEVGCMIFDEIDTGISGNAAKKVGIKLKEISNNKQVLCVTHLPQIAAMAEYHYLIEKNIFEKSVSTNISLLNKQERINQVSKMISGGNVTDLGIKFAEELINNN